jgi:hypothetical protein
VIFVRIKTGSGENKNPEINPAETNEYLNND